MKQVRYCERCKQPVRPFPVYHRIKHCLPCGKVVRVELERARRAKHQAA